MTPRLPRPFVVPRHVAKRMIVTDTGCVLWDGALSPDGYGWSHLNNRSRQAHRLVYELFVGPIPDGLVIDHLCRIRHCVNPLHLEAVTYIENLRRGIGTHGRDHCGKCSRPLQLVAGARRCPPCYRAYRAAYMRRKRAAA